jgi:hypothetical protein
MALHIRARLRAVMSGFMSAEGRVVGGEVELECGEISAKVAA